MISPEILFHFAVALGGVVGGIVGAKKLPLTRNGNSKKGNPGLALSDKTGGAKHISEEALGKIQAIEDKILTEDSHRVICAGERSEGKLYVAEELKKYSDESLNRIDKLLEKSDERFSVALENVKQNIIEVINARYNNPKP